MLEQKDILIILGIGILVVVALYILLNKSCCENKVTIKKVSPTEYMTVSDKGKFVFEKYEDDAVNQVFATPGLTDQDRKDYKDYIDFIKSSEVPSTAIGQVRGAIATCTTKFPGQDMLSVGDKFTCIGEAVDKIAQT